MSIRRPLPEPAAASTPSNPPPAYNELPPNPNPNRTVNAGAFRANSNASNYSARPHSAVVPPSSSSDMYYADTRPLNHSSRPQTMHATSASGSFLPPPGSPPQQTQSQSQTGYKQPSGPPPPQHYQQQQHARTPSMQSQQGAGLARSNTREDPLSVLKRYDTCLLIDDSISMEPLWLEVETALAGIVETVIRYDADGIDIHFLNSPHSLIGAKHSGDIRELFQSVLPVGESTPTEVRVEELIGDYIEKCERAKRTSVKDTPKPLNMLVLTDGEADDPDTLADVLIGFAKRLDEINASRTQLGIQFVQIGDDPNAAEALRVLDDELASKDVRDMVDTTPYQGSVSAEFLVKVALGSINRRIDKQNN